MNVCCFVGNIGYKGDLMFSSSQTAYIKFSVAINGRRNRSGEQSTNFINCTAFGKVAEVIDKWFKVGSKIGVEASVNTSSYTDKDGKKRTSVEFLVSNVTFAEKAKSRNTEYVVTKTKEAAAGDDGFMNIPAGIEEDLPFK